MKKKFFKNSYLEPSLKFFLPTSAYPKISKGLEVAFTEAKIVCKRNNNLCIKIENEPDWKGRNFDAIP